MTRLPVALIAAVARNGVIGDGNRLIWKLSTDLKRFKRLTMGKPLIIGRKTYQSIARPLPGRETIVVTRDGAFARPGARFAPDIETALSIADAIAHAAGQDEIIVAGGGEIYSQTIGLADRLYITEVDVEPPGDATFPAIDQAVWREVRRERPARSERDEADFAFVDYERREPIETRAR